MKLLFRIVLSTFLKGISRGIISGSPASYTDYDQTVAVIDQKGWPFCGGVLLTLTQSLTACRCIGEFEENVFIPKSIRNLTVAVGSGWIRGSAQRREVRDAYPHPDCSNYVSSWSFDYGVFVVRAPFDLLGSSFKTLVLVSGKRQNVRYYLEEYISDRLKCTVVGWGNSRINSSSPPHERLHYATVQLVPWSECQESLCKHSPAVCTSLVDRRRADKICAKALSEVDAGDWCDRDWGSPLYCEGNVYAIASWSLGCEARGLPKLYSTLYAADDFISSIKESGAVRSYATLSGKIVYLPLFMGFP